MLFKDRKDAGIQLAEKLQEFLDHPKAILIALPRGGVVVGHEIAKKLHLPLDIVVPRKVGAPGNPEFAVGAITETGEGIFSDSLLKKLGISPKYLEEQIEVEKKEARRRLLYYRGNQPARDVKGKLVILVDDGLATGSTMVAAIKTMRKEEVEKLIVAVPVSPPDTAQKITALVDRFYCLATPFEFYAVGQFYDHFTQTSDEEVLSLLSG